MNAGTLFVSLEADFAKFASQMATLADQFKDVGRESAQQIAEGIAASKAEMDDAIGTVVTKAAESVTPAPVTKAINDAVVAAGTGGTAAASGFSSKFSSYMDRAKGQLEKRLSSFISPLSLLTAAEAAVENGLQGGLLSGLEKLVNSTPLVGSLYRIGTMFGDKIAESFTEYGAMEKAMEERAKQMETRVAGALMREKSLQEELGGIAEARASVIESRRKAQLAEAQMSSDPFQALGMEAIHAEERLREQYELKRAKAKSDHEKRILHEAYTLELEAAESVYQKKRADLIKEEERQKQAAEQAAELQAQRDAKIAEDAAIKANDLADRKKEKDLKDAADLAEALARQFEDLSAERIAAQAAGVGEVQTALGAFRFDAYPQEMKRANDERIVKALEDIRGKQALTGGFA